MLQKGKPRRASTRWDQATSGGGKGAAGRRDVLPRSSTTLGVRRSRSRRVASSKERAKAERVSLSGRHGQQRQQGAGDGRGLRRASRQRAPSGDGECRVCRQKRVGEFFNRSQDKTQDVDAGRKSSDGTGTCQQKRIVRRDCVNPLSPPISHRIGCVVSGAARPVSWHPEDTCALPGVVQWQLAASRVSTLSPVAKAKPSKNTTASHLCNGSAFPASLPWLPLFSTTDPSSRDDTRLPHSRSTLTCPGIFFVFTNITPESSTLPRSHHRLQDLRQVVQLFQLCLPSLRCTNCKIKQHFCCTHVGTRPCQDSKVKSPSPSLEMLILEHHVIPLIV